MNQIITEPSKKNKIAGFLRTYNLTYGKLGELLGVSDQGAYKMLNADQISEERLKQLKNIGIPFPEELLPEAKRPKVGLTHSGAGLIPPKASKIIK